MTEPTLLDAVDIVSERKRAAIGEQTFLDTLRGETELAGRLMLAGTDLDPEEANGIAHAIGHGSIVTTAIAAQHGQLCVALGGIWLDGLLTGLILADLRARRATEG